MQCGAQRRKPKAEAVTRPDVDPVKRPDVVMNPKPAKARNAHRVTRKNKLNLAIAATPEAFARRRSELAKGGILHRVKALTNAPDHYLAKVINRARVTVQAYLNERLPFTPDRWQLQQLHQLLLQQRLMLDDAIDHIEAAIEDARK